MKTKETKMQTTVNKKKSVATLVSLLGLVINATVFDAQAEPIWIVGVCSCGAWVKDRQEKQIFTITHQRWLVGYLSGLARASNKNILKGTDNDSFYLWMDNYCQKNPLKDISDGAEDLSFELIKQKNL